MKFSDLIAMCARSLWRRKVRTLLTVFGVVIGTCSIIVMVSLGIGIGEYNMQWINQMGDLTIITVYPDWNSSTSDQVKLNDEKVAAIKKLENVTVATPFMSLDAWSMPLGSDDRYKYQGSIVGVDLDALEAFGYTAATGRLFNSGDPDNVAVFGSEAAYQFMDTKRKRNNYVDSTPDMNGKVKDPFVNAMKDDFQFYLVNQNDQNANGNKLPDRKSTLDKLKVVGVLDPGESSNWQFDKSYTIYVSINYAMKLQAEYNKVNGTRSSEKTYSQVYVKAADIDTVEQVEEDIKAMGFQTSSMASVRKQMSEQMQTIQLVLGGIGGISMIVAALSITNTMIMSIYERTREIGVMKVLGCRLGNIRAMFLGEAAMIGLIGGAVGVGISFGISSVLNLLLGGAMGMGYGGGSLSIIPFWLVLLGMAFATGVGLVAGVAPANRAVKISAIEAIRHD